MQPTYSALLVWVSVVVASLASYTALDLASRVTAAKSDIRPYWLAGGACIMGCGIWSMHFLGMLAFHLPVGISYDIPLMTLSVVVAILASAFALHVAARSSVRTQSLALAAPFMGGAIAGMHYLGMASMRMDAHLGWRWGLVGASVAIAITASFVALWLAARFRSDTSARGRWGKIGAAIVMGVAISGMHYTGMAAARFSPLPGGVHVEHAHVLPTAGLGVAIFAFAMLLLGTAAVVALFDRKLALSSALAAENEELYRTSQVEIAQRRRAEAALRVSEEALRHAQRMEAVGRLAGGVAHDFNNILTAIKGYTELILAETPATDPRRRDLEEVDRAADRAASLTQQLLAFSRKQVLQPQILDLNAVVRGMEKLLRRLIGEDIALTTRLDPGLGRVKADPGQMEHVLLNLVVNARDAMPGGGRLSIETRNHHLDIPFSSHDVRLPAGRYASIVVRDSGSGIDVDTLTMIFEPFFTTKELGKGTGLGLSTAYGIVSQSGGTIRVSSTVGQGAVFEILLPLAEQLNAVDADASSHVGIATILLVEDESAVRERISKGHTGA